MAIHLILGCLMSSCKTPFIRKAVRRARVMKLLWNGCDGSEHPMCSLAQTAQCAQCASGLLAVGWGRARA